MCYRATRDGGTRALGPALPVAIDGDRARVFEGISRPVQSERSPAPRPRDRGTVEPLSGLLNPACDERKMRSRPGSLQVARAGRLDGRGSPLAQGVYVSLVSPHLVHSANSPWNRHLCSGALELEHVQLWQSCFSPLTIRHTVDCPFLVMLATSPPRVGAWPARGLGMCGRGPLSRLAASLLVAHFPDDVEVPLIVPVRCDKSPLVCVAVVGHG